MTPPYGNMAYLLGIFQLLCLVGGGQGIDEFVQASVHNGVDLIKGQSHPVIRDPALGEIVGADPLVAHAGAHLGAAQAACSDSIRSCSIS